MLEECIFYQIFYSPKTLSKILSGTSDSVGLEKQRKKKEKRWTTSIFRFNKYRIILYIRAFPSLINYRAAFEKMLTITTEVFNAKRGTF